MQDSITTFAIIGKPNNGKSSIISALTMDDRIEVGENTGTTTKAALYAYEYDGETVCRFYDTPGFEMAKELWRFIEQTRGMHLFGNDLFREFIKLHKSKSEFAKDIHILEAIMKSDFLIFIVDVSKRPNINQMGSELSIIKTIDKPKVVMFNQIEQNDYTPEWKKFLQSFDLEYTLSFDPMRNNITNIAAVFEKLYRAGGEKAHEKLLEKVLLTHKKQFEYNLKYSCDAIARTLLEMLQTNYVYTVKGKKITKEEKEKAYRGFVEKISDLERKLYGDIKRIWGYYSVAVKDNRVEFDAKENVRMGLTPARLIALGAASGGGLGAWLAPIDGGLSMAVGAGAGAIGAYVLKEKFYSVVISKKKIVYSVGKKEINTSFILLSRMLQHLEAIIRHGHANREAIVIEELKPFTFSKEMQNLIKETHIAFIADEKVLERKKALSNALYEEVVQLHR